MCMFAALAVPYRVCSSFHSESDTNTLTHTHTVGHSDKHRGRMRRLCGADRQTDSRQAGRLAARQPQPRRAAAAAKVTCELIRESRKS